MPKDITRTVRLSQEHFDRINGMEGKDFTQKFENMVDHYWFEKPELEAELSELRAQIVEARAELKRIHDQTSKVKACVAAVQHLGDLAHILYYQIDPPDFGA